MVLAASDRNTTKFITKSHIKLDLLTYPIATPVAKVVNNEKPLAITNNTSNGGEAPLTIIGSIDFNVINKV